MSQKPVSLSSHKSQIERTRRKKVRAEMTRDAKAMASDDNIVAFAIVAFTDDGRAKAAWDTGGVLPMWAFPQTVSEVLRCDLETSGVDDDFRKPLVDQAWKGSK